jgi:1,4-alpha-glucan branching enzyme
MLYLDYSRRPGEWIPNRFGGREDLDAVDFSRQLTDAIREDHPDVDLIAEESTAWPGVTHPTSDGGLGFGHKWDMGWMHDTLEYVQRDPIARSYHHDDLTRRQLWAYTERYVLPLSHDEVVHGKSSLLGRMPGDAWQQLANLRALFGYQWTQPGKKLLFMGGEIAQRSEWHHDGMLDWATLGEPGHAGVQRYVADLNRAYRDLPALHAFDEDPAGFSWVQFDDASSSTLSYLRFSDAGDVALVICNFTPVPRHDRHLAVPHAGEWREVLNSDAPSYGGSGIGNLGGVVAVRAKGDDHAWLSVTMPPLACVIFAFEGA